LSVSAYSYDILTTNCTLYFLSPPPHSRSTLFPYTTLFRSCIYTVSPEGVKYINVIETLEKYDLTFAAVAPSLLQLLRPYFPEIQDRKSTRLNSSHVSISYAVFCLKKKIQNK